MGRSVTEFTTECRIFNHSIESIDQAKYLLEKTKEKINELEAKLKAVIIGGVKVLRTPDDEYLSDLDLLEREVFERDGGYDGDGIVPSLQELYVQESLLRGIVDGRWVKKEGSEDNWEHIEVKLDVDCSGHYDGQGCYSASETRL